MKNFIKIAILFSLMAQINFIQANINIQSTGTSENKDFLLQTLFPTNNICLKIKNKRRKICFSSTFENRDYYHVTGVGKPYQIVELADHFQLVNYYEDPSIIEIHRDKVRFFNFIVERFLREGVEVYKQDDLIAVLSPEDVLRHVQVELEEVRHLRDSLPDWNRAESMNLSVPGAIITSAGLLVAYFICTAVASDPDDCNPFLKDSNVQISVEKEW